MKLHAISFTERVGDLSQTTRLEFTARRPGWHRACIIGTLGYLAAGLLILSAVIAHGVARKHGLDVSWLL